MSNSSTPTKLNLPTVTSLVIGNMVGTGIFLLPASLAAFGTISIFAWIFTSIGALLLALTFASLNQKVPKSGGPYIFCKEAYGDFIGFLVAYTYWTSLWVATAGVAVAAIGYLGFIVKGLNPASASTYHPVAAFIIETIAVWFFIGINVLGIRTAGFVQLLLTIIKTVPLLVISAIGIFKIDFHNLMHFNISGTSNLTALTSAATLAVWAFIGLETATIPADNTHGTKDVYRATIFGTVIASAIYMISTFVLMGLISVVQLKGSTSPFADAANLLFGHNMGYVIAVFAIIAGLGTLNVSLLTVGQIPMAAGRDNLFPSTFAKLSRWQTPLLGFLISGGLITILLFLTINGTLMKQFNILALLATMATLATYFICAMAELMLLIRDPSKFSRATFIKSVIVASLAGVFVFWLIIGAGQDVVFYGTLLLLTSFPLYAWLIAKRKKPTIAIEAA